jgi:predicted GTPase
MIFSLTTSGVFVLIIAFFLCKPIEGNINAPNDLHFDQNKVNHCGDDVNLSSQDMIKVVLIGETGVGKSTIGNSLIKQEVFEVGGGIDAQTISANSSQGRLLGV